MGSLLLMGAGKGGGAAAAVAATGSITIIGTPEEGETVTVGGKTYTFTVGVAGPDEIFVDDGPWETGNYLATEINDDTATTLCTSQLPGEVPPHILVLTANTPGAAGNSITLSEAATNVTVQAFSGGSG